MTHELDLEAVVGRFYTSLYRFALSLTKNEAEAGDLTQQTFFILAQRSHQIRDTSKVKCWLFTTSDASFFVHCEFNPAIRTWSSVRKSMMAPLFLPTHCGPWMRRR